MASFNIHLAIGKRYIEKSNIIQNEEDFYKGIIDPDLVDDKKISHYTGSYQDKSDLLKYLENKVQLNEFLKDNNINSDYQKGVFLHLITDYLFFNNFFDNDYLKNVSYEEFCKDLYYSYDIINQHIEDKYKINYANFSNKINNNIEKSKKEKNITNEARKNILSLSNLDRFIEYVSDISLEDYKNKIMKNKTNVLP